MVITRTKIRPPYIFTTPFDVVFNALFEHSYNPGCPLQKQMFLQMSIRRVPDLIFGAFDMLSFPEFGN